LKGVDAWSAKRLPVARVGEDMTKADEDEIRAIELRFNEARGQHDPDGMVESLVDDAQFVTVNGAWTRTREEFRDLMHCLHGPNGPFRVLLRCGGRRGQRLKTLIK
jgi:hypothetical protein